MKAVECRDAFARLSEYIDGELPADLCAELDRHIADCEPCVEFVESLRKARALCRGFRGAQAPGPLEPEARERLRAALVQCLGGGGAAEAE